MTTEPFTPHADSIQTAWVLMCQQSRISTQPPVEELEAEFGRFLARVRRDAAREALGGLADEAIHVNWEMDGPAFALRVRRFKNRKYPEETP
ncbi:hypothetical protein [Brachybacterium massiliense]|uniref:hypothetical protein n=1 Tax=Brachybacterium massiliense TaxID=1755098 RepID=UPI000B3BD1AA|nr:hypothetical protein [Brachybacterium massiliense]